MQTPSPLDALMAAMTLPCAAMRSKIDRVQHPEKVLMRLLYPSPLILTSTQVIGLAVRVLSARGELEDYPTLRESIEILNEEGNYLVDCSA